MTFPAAPLQKAVYSTLRDDAAVVAALNGEARIYDRVPPQASPAGAKSGAAFPYVTIGDDQVVDDSTDCGDAYELFVTVHIWSRDVGKVASKLLASAIRAALDVPLAIDGFVVVVHEFNDARFFREPDGLTEHGVLTFRYLVDPN